MARTKYLNNKDLLAEIHKSKTSYCYYEKPEYHQFDLILDEVKKINRNTIKEARLVRAKRLSEQKIEALGLKVKKTTMDEHAIDPKSIPIEDLIFRVKTFDHIPDDLDRKSNHKTIADTKVKLNFVPFKHYKFKNYEKKELVEVGKSHYASHNQFSLDHGSITPKLGHMYMKLCQRYGTRSNWRGYTYNDEMQSQALLQLSMIGLQFDESKSDNPFAYYTAAITNSFTRVLNMEKKHQSLRDDLLQEAGQTPSFTRQIEHEEKQKEKHGEQILGHAKRKK